MISKEEQKRMVNQFDAYIKKVIKFAYAKYCRDNKSLYNTDYSLEEFTDKLLLNDINPETQIDISNHYSFNGYIITVNNDELCRLLDEMDENSKKIILLYYIEGLSDSKIAKILNLETKKVNRYRHKALNFLKENFYYE